MVKKIAALFILTLVGLAGYTQSALLDDIKLMNALRNQQVLHAYASDEDEDDKS